MPSVASWVSPAIFTVFVSRTLRRRSFAYSCDRRFFFTLRPSLSRTAAARIVARKRTAAHTDPKAKGSR